MDAQALQKCDRLSQRISSLGFLILVASMAGACARDLKTDEDLAIAPEEFDQKIVEIDLNTLEKSALAESSKSKPTTTSSKATPPKVAAVRQATPAAKTGQTPAPAAVVPSAASLARVWPMGMGERASYNLRWGLIEAGVVSLEVKPPQNIEGVPALHYSGSVKSSKVMELFYKIDNTIDAWVRLSDLAPLRQEIRQLESARWGRRVLLADPDQKRVRFYEHLTTSRGEVKEIKRDDKMLAGAQDIFSALYFYRFIQEGFDEGYRFPIHDNGKNWYADLRVEARETVRVPAGIFKTRRSKVIPRLEGNLKPQGDVTVWTSDDDKNLLVKFSAKIKVGSVTGELIEHIEGSRIELAIPQINTPVKSLKGPVAKE
jgi:hypothetical protein